jgi:thiol-disulfide isomerase/thioredoxin
VKTIPRIISTVAAVVFLPAAVQSGEITLKVGDPAPKLQVSKWVQGEPVKEFEKGTAYIVEFWATWCGPCRVSIPHLNELHNKYKDKGLVVIGQDVWERDESGVEPFVKKMGNQMTYRVALDSKENFKDGAMAVTWMKAAGQNGIPTAFVVDKQGVIAWIGHPMSLKEKLLDQVLAGTFDVKKAAADHAKAKENEEKLAPLARSLNKALRDEQWGEAENILNDIAKVIPESDMPKLEMIRLRITVKKEDYPAAFKLAEKLSDSNLDDPDFQNELAWDMATGEQWKKRDLDLAEKIARRAVKASEEKEPNSIDTLARVLFLKGQKDEAIKLQEKAVNLSKGDAKKRFQDVLKSYKEGKLPED